MMTAKFNRVIIARGSVTGNAEDLSRQLSRCPCFASENMTLVDLDQVQLTELASNDLLLIVTSTFGDGDPPDNAFEFFLQLRKIEAVPSFQFAVFALGDITYTNFCQFGKDVDTQLADKGAARIINRVDADIDFSDFFYQWKDTVCAVMAGSSQQAEALNLHVVSYDENSPHPAEIISLSPLNKGANLIYQLELDIKGSGMNYRAGDLLYVMPENKCQLSLDLAVWFNDDRAIALLQGKELRLLGKSLLRVLANKSNNEDLKKNLKMRHKLLLADYLYGRDLLDVLQDCGEPGFISLAELVDILPEQTPRAYSIASSGKYFSNGEEQTQVNLCIREVAYEYNQRSHFGAASHGIRHNRAGGMINVFIRSNPSFHLEYESDKPIIMIGAGTGIAPYIGFLQQIEKQSIQPETLLVFGERYRQKDFLYQEQLEQWLENGILNQLVTAFSRDQEEKFYVQDAMIEHGEKLWSLLSQGAIIYICGSKKNLGKAIDQALILILLEYSGLSLEEAEDYIVQLSDNKRYHRDLY